MRLTLLGTGDARQLPVRGVSGGARRSGPAAVAVQRADRVRRPDAWLIDSRPDRPHRTFSAAQLERHSANSLPRRPCARPAAFALGPGVVIPVHGPADPEGLADLYKHPGILDFSQPFAAFETRALGALQVTALPLMHSRLTFGYLLEGEGQRIAYLTDTVGLPDATREFLQRQPLDLLILDCSMPPQPSRRAITMT